MSENGFSVTFYEAVLKRKLSYYKSRSVRRIERQGAKTVSLTHRDVGSHSTISVNYCTYWAVDT